MGFIDFKKACDIIKHPYMLNALKKAGVEDWYVDIIEEIYSNLRAEVCLEKPGKELRIQRGVRQGDPLSPDLFNHVIQKIFNEINLENSGISIAGHTLSNLKFADDVVLFQDTAAKLEKALNELTNFCKPAGLELNLNKTFILTNSTQTEIKINNLPIKYEDEVTYLGQKITFNNMMEKELQTRISNSWKGFWKLQKIFKGNFDLKLKIKTSERCIYPILIYSCQT